MLLVAVSGGVDSMSLAEKVRLQGGPFAIAHCNFGLRGSDSDADEALVRAWAEGYGIRCHVKRFETAACAAAEGISIEMAARRLRYHWFGELCREYGYEAVAVAHNANDNAETLLLNLLRGTGLRGITGMKAEGRIPDPDFADIPLLRPLLGLTREEIEAFAREHGLPWREDATNAENGYKRNKLRNLVFPVFKEINPSFVQTLNRDMERFASELSTGREGAEPPESCVAPLLVPPTSCQDGEHASMPPISPVRGPLPFMRPWAATDSWDSAPSLPSDFSGFAIIKEEWDGSREVKQPAGVLILDAEKTGEYTLGYWETGDWIRPLGAPGRKKMQDWFTDHHIPADEKRFYPLLKSARDPHHVLAVVGCCIDHSVRVTASTRHIFRISAKID